MPIPGSADNGEPGVPVARPQITYGHMIASEYEKLAQEVEVRSPLDLLRFMFQTGGGKND